MKSRKRMDYWMFVFYIFFIIFDCPLNAVEVHFENKDGGFFLKHIPRQFHTASADLSGTAGIPLLPSTGTVLSVDRFTVFQNSQPISVRATYGPFSTKQTVPARYIVPDPLDTTLITERQQQRNNSSSSVFVDMQELSAAATHHLDMSAHIVRHEIPRDSPVLRVLFHTGSDPGGRRQLFFSRHQRVCIVLHATLPGRIPLTTACSPDGEDGVCLAQITIPSKWWPPMSPPDAQNRNVKTPPHVIHIAYSVLEPKQGCVPRVQIQPVTQLGLVSLVPAKSSYKELRADEHLTMMIPHIPLYPLSRLYVPVFLQDNVDAPITMFVVRARVKSGLRILGAEASSPRWNISMDLNPKHTGATVTAIYREALGKSQPQSNMKPDDIPSVLEIFTWLLEVVDDSTELWDGARIVWTVRYVGSTDTPLALPSTQDQADFVPIAPPSVNEFNTPGTNQDLIVTQSEGRKKLTARLEVQKDDIQAVLPISKNWEVMNTAVLTGRQVSQAMKIFIVSQAGKAADVTLQSSCHSEDESVLKVSSSCSSVYVDGSEARGSVNGSVLVKYGTYTGLAQFTVWMPEFPLEIVVPDVRLSQIKAWRVLDNYISPGKSSRQKRAYGWTKSDGLLTDDINGVGNEHPVCRLRYQQTPVDVYGRFFASDHESGRISYFISRRTWLRVTDLVTSLLRVSDPRIAELSGRILQGRTMGRTEVQVLSPITGRVIGAKEVRVVNDKVSLTKVSVNVVSGLQLNISPDSAIENGYIAETSVTKRLTAQYQEGLLDIELEFSDGSKIPLRDVSDADYHLVVESLNPDIVAFAPMVASHHPRVIAVGEGNGDLLKIALLLNEECRMHSRTKSNGKAHGVLATAAAAVDVDFSVGDLPNRPDFVQNDGGILLKDDHHHEPTVQARQHHSIALGPHGRTMIKHSRLQANLTPLEIGMYVLLAAFCFAIVVFVVSCVVYASKFKPQNPEGGVMLSSPQIINGNNSFGIQREPRKPRPATMNAHDWVWLGRATMERNSGQIVSSARCHNNNNITNNLTPINDNEQQLRITTNPMSANYSDPDDCLITSFQNSNQIELPSGAPLTIDSTTYSKSQKVNARMSGADLIPPPLPPHGIVINDKNRNKLKPDDDEYKPPVPPHRNIGVTAHVSPSLTETPVPVLRNKHRHRFQNHRILADMLDVTSNVENIIAGKDVKKNAFTFDDALPSVSADSFQNGLLQLGTNCDDKKSESTKVSNDDNEMGDFVEFPKSTSNNSNGISIRGNSPEVKTATIVGNPMFANEKEEVKLTNASTELDELQLDMDYEQIMHYFNNLKESNA